MESDYKKIGSEGSQWLINSMICTIISGVGAFLIGLNSLNPYFGKLLVSLGYLISGTLCVLYSLIFQGPSIHIKNEPGLFASIMSGVFYHFANFSMFLGYHYDPQHSGIISIMTIGSAIIASSISYLIYKEKLSISQIIGMSICTVGLVIIGISSSSEGLSRNPFIGFICGISAMIFFSIKNIFARKAERDGIEMFKSIIICLFFEGFSGCLNIGLMWFFVDIFGNTHQFWITLIAGFLFGIATIFVTFAVMAGKIGPSIMIANSMGIYQMALDYFIKGVIPGVGQLIGGIITISGVAILLLWKEIIGKSSS